MISNGFGYPKTRNPGGKPDLFITRTRLFLPEPINSDVVGMPKKTQNPMKTRLLFWYSNQGYGTRPEPDFCYPNPSLAMMQFDREVTLIAVIVSFFCLFMSCNWFLLQAKRLKKTLCRLYKTVCFSILCRKTRDTYVQTQYIG